MRGAELSGSWATPCTDKERFGEVEPWVDSLALLPGPGPSLGPVPPPTRRGEGRVQGVRVSAILWS